jgi:hypothetical protein
MLSILAAYEPCHKFGTVFAIGWDRLPANHTSERQPYGCLPRRPSPAKAVSRITCNNCCKSNRNLFKHGGAIMRSRSRRSASNYISAAILEIMIMGIFVIIAQPQLREALFEILHPAGVPTVQAQPAGYGFESAVVNTDSRLRPMSHSMAMSAPSLLQPAASGVMSRTSHYAPLEQYESFSVPTNNSPISTNPINNSPINNSHINNSPSNTNPINNYQAANHFASHDMQSIAGWNSGRGVPTQITAGEWNIVSAAQSPRPLSGWTAPHSAGANYLDTYPPPYGTQSQWK